MAFSLASEDEENVLPDVEALRRRIISQVLLTALP